MRKSVLLIVLLCVAFAGRVHGQFTIPTVELNKQVGATPLADTVRRGSFSNEYFSLARWKAEKRELRKKRNTVEFNATLAATQTQFINWQAGGSNTFSARSTMLFHHLYKRDKFSLDYRVDARYGMNYIDNAMYKNEDEFKANLIMAWTMHKHWSYAATANLRSQFSKGYKSRTDSTLISDFMAPGFFDLSIGFNFKKDGSPWNITLSPIAGSIVMVLDKELRENGIAGVGISGVPLGDRTKGQLGPSVRIFFDKEFGKKAFRYRSSLYSFCNIRTPPTCRWENTLDIRATKVLTTSLYWLFYYDKYSGTTEPQYNYSISVGLSYWIKNK